MFGNTSSYIREKFDQLKSEDSKTPEKIDISIQII